jgi:hypothetical protein
MDSISIPWNPYGMTLAEAPAIFSFHIHYDSIWNSHGMVMEWTWNDVFHMDSISIPYGFHTDWFT